MWTNDSVECIFSACQELQSGRTYTGGRAGLRLQLVRQNGCRCDKSICIGGHRPGVPRTLLRLFLHVETATLAAGHQTR